MKLRRPVTWQEDRREHFLSATQERDQHWKVAIAVDAGRKNPRSARRHAARQRRIPAVGHHRALYRRHHVPRPLCGAGLCAGGDRRAFTNRVPDHGRARRRPAAGRVRDGTADGPRRRASSGSIAPTLRAPQHDRARADAVLRRACCSATASRWSMPAEIFRKASAGRSRFRITGAFAHAKAARAPRDAISASASAITSRGRGSGPSQGVTGARSAQRQGCGRDRRHVARTGHAHDTVADRGGPRRLPPGRYCHDRRRYFGHLPGRGRVCQPAGHQCRLLRADGRGTACATRSSCWPRACWAWRRATSTSRTAAPPGAAATNLR